MITPSPPPTRATTTSGSGLDVARIEVVSFDLDGTLIDSRAALHIGDMRGQDIAGARAAGWQSAWVNRSGVTPEDEHDPDVEIASLDELVDLLGLR